MESLITEDQKSKTPVLTLFFVTLVVGIGSGFLGMLLALLLHYVQHIAYGYSPLAIMSDESFLEGVAASSPQRRVLILMLCGLIAGIGWALIYRFGKPLVSISEALKANKTMPGLSTSCHALLQIITIALGSPLGREVAPREASAIFASWISSKARLNPDEVKIMLACGAGAGLAAVYNVPLAGALFTLEVLLCSVNWFMVLPALSTAAIAVLVSWWGLGNEALYYVPSLTINPSIIIWSLCCGPIFGFTAFWFIKIASLQRSYALRNRRMILTCFINFTLIGLLAIYFPALLGNGKSPVQIAFAHPVSMSLTAVLLILRCLITWSSLRAGAQGGLLTPSLATGALMGILLGGLWCLCFPTCPLEAFAIIGACAFLAAAQKMPITALIMVFELTRIDLIFFVPMMLAVAGSIGMYHLANKSGCVTKKT